MLRLNHATSRNIHCCHVIRDVASADRHYACMRCMRELTPTDILRSHLLADTSCARQCAPIVTDETVCHCYERDRLEEHKVLHIFAVSDDGEK